MCWRWKQTTHTKFKMVFGCNIRCPSRHEKSNRIRVYPWKGNCHFVIHEAETNARSSTKAELNGVDDQIGKVLWTKRFLQAQGFKMKLNIIYQDNQSTMKLASNGKASSGDTSFWYQTIICDRSNWKGRSASNVLSHRGNDCRLQHETTGRIEVYQVPRFDHESIGHPSPRGSAGVCWQTNISTYDTTCRRRNIACVHLEDGEGINFVGSAHVVLNKHSRERKLEKVAMVHSWSFCSGETRSASWFHRCAGAISSREFVDRLYAFGRHI